MNLYGTKPYRTWIMMKNYSQRMSDPEAYRDHGTSQFSSQEKNQEDLDNILHQVHDDFHNYFILIIISLTAFNCAILILLIIVTLCSYCRRSKHDTCQAQNFNPNVLPLPVRDRSIIKDCIRSLNKNRNCTNCRYECGEAIFNGKVLEFDFHIQFLLGSGEICVNHAVNLIPNLKSRNDFCFKEQR